MTTRGGASGAAATRARPFGRSAVFLLLTSLALPAGTAGDSPVPSAKSVPSVEYQRPEGRAATLFASDSTILRFSLLRGEKLLELRSVAHLVEIPVVPGQDTVSLVIFDRLAQVG